MDINDLMLLQVTQDKAHGFPVDFASPRERYDQLTRDLVGLFGEIGEFSNIVKKVNIKLSKPTEYELDLPTAETALRDELIDSLLYVLRLGAILKMDLEKAALDKMRANMDRYAKLRNQ